jgi:hypothetical protein
MLGVLRCLPAFDRFFRLGFGRAALNHATLSKIGDFYTSNKSALHSVPVRTLDFASGQDTSRCYTQAKIIDMIFFHAAPSPLARPGGNRPRWAAPASRRVPSTLVNHRSRTRRPGAGTGCTP